GVMEGAGLPRWQVQQVTTCRPPKLSRLMAFTMVTILRAICFRGGSASHCGFDVPAPTWQSPQQTLNAAEKSPIVPMNSSTGMPFSTWIFLKACSDICGLAAAGACARARTTPAEGAPGMFVQVVVNRMLIAPAIAPTRSTRFAGSFIYSSTYKFD